MSFLQISSLLRCNVLLPVNTGALCKKTIRDVLIIHDGSHAECKDLRRRGFVAIYFKPNLPKISFEPTYYRKD